MAKNSGFPMGGVEDTGVEAALPKVAGGPLEGVAIFGILAVQVHHETGNGLAAITDGDQMEVIAEEDISGDAHVPFLTAVSTRVRKCWHGGPSAPDARINAKVDERTTIPNIRIKEILQQAVRRINRHMVGDE